ncbi:MAG: hypothetical protein ACYTGV_11145 [Planctomycetota bacterium]|jgi:hypothetical protein
MKDFLSRMLLFGVTACTISLFAAGASQATAVYVGFLDDPEFLTHWTLTIDDLDDAIANTYSFELTANTQSNSGWYTHALMLHLDGGEKADITSFTAPASNWNALDANSVPIQVDIEGFGGELIPMSAWVAFYTDEVTPTLDDPTSDPTELMAGVALDGGVYTWTANFTLTNPLNPYPSLQAFTYDGLNGGSGKIAHRRMSETFVPEPNAAVLFAVGGLIVGSAVRRRSEVD